MMSLGQLPPILAISTSKKIQKKSEYLIRTVCLIFSHNKNMTINMFISVTEQSLLSLHPSQVMLGRLTINTEQLLKTDILHLALFIAHVERIYYGKQQERN